MDGTIWYAVLLGAALLAANLPFLSERLFFLISPTRAKAFGWRLAELGAMYALIGLLAYVLEARQGQVYPQGWEFYAATACFFLVLAYPGFVWRFLWSGRK
jgi:hypothetical protein